MLANFNESTSYPVYSVPAVGIAPWLHHVAKEQFLTKCQKDDNCCTLTHSLFFNLNKAL